MSGTRILIVDDEPVVRATMTGLLNKRGYEVIAARNGEEAYELLHRDAAPRLAIVDWMMPGIDGVELCRRLRASPKTQYTYLIMLSGRRDHEDMVEGLNGGADDYMTKPFNVEELDARLRSAQRRIAQQEELATSAGTDSLTGVPNRTEIFDMLQRELGYADIDCRALSVLLIGIDDMTGVNRAHGHVAGDSALRQVSRSISERLRPFDSMGRFGGDEFIVVLPACDLPDAAQAAERVRSHVESQPLCTAIGAVALTVSVGLATADPGSRDVQTLVESAEESLRRAKDAGRNRIDCTWPANYRPRPLEVSGLSEDWPVM